MARPQPVMMVVVLLCAGALAGCAAPQDDAEDPLIGVCPHWSARGDPLVRTFDVPANGTLDQEWVPRDHQSGEPRLSMDGRTFDRIVVEVQNVAFAGEGEQNVGLSATNGTGRALLLYEHGRTEGPRSVPSAHLGALEATRVFDVYLAPVTEGSQWDPSPIWLHWDAQSDATVTVKVTLHDRVCGIP